MDDSPTERDPEPSRGGLRIGPSRRIDLDEPREIKVKLPIELHLKLHALKITARRSISEVVLEALEQYVARLEKK